MRAGEAARAGDVLLLRQGSVTERPLYRLWPNGRLDRIIANAASPNGVAVSREGTPAFLALSRLPAANRFRRKAYGNIAPGADVGASLQDAARELRVSARSLQRHLAEMGTSCSEMVAPMRLDTACHLLTEFSERMSQIAARLKR